jgi:hypothetical protein
MKQCFIEEFCLNLVPTIVAIAEFIVLHLTIYYFSVFHELDVVPTGVASVAIDMEDPVDHLASTRSRKNGSMLANEMKNCALGILNGIARVQSNV